MEAVVELVVVGSIVVVVDCSVVEVEIVAPPDLYLALQLDAVIETAEMMWLRKSLCGSPLMALAASDLLSIIIRIHLEPDWSNIRSGIHCLGKDTKLSIELKDDCKMCALATFSLQECKCSEGSRRRCPPENY